MWLALAQGCLLVLGKEQSELDLIILPCLEAGGSLCLVTQRVMGGRTCRLLGLCV